MQSKFIRAQTLASVRKSRFVKEKDIIKKKKYIFTLFEFHLWTGFTYHA
jgi:hypothetical protein